MLDRLIYMDEMKNKKPRVDTQGQIICLQLTCEETPPPQKKIHYPPLAHTHTHINHMSFANEANYFGNLRLN